MSQSANMAELVRLSELFTPYTDVVVERTWDYPVGPHSCYAIVHTISMEAQGLDGIAQVKDYVRSAYRIGTILDDVDQMCRGYMMPHLDDVKPETLGSNPALYAFAQDMAWLIKELRRNELLDAIKTARYCVLPRQGLIRRIISSSIKALKDLAEMCYGQLREDLLDIAAILACFRSMSLWTFDPTQEIRARLQILTTSLCLSSLWFVLMNYCDKAYPYLDAMIDALEQGWVSGDISFRGIFAAISDTLFGGVPDVNL